MKALKINYFRGDVSITHFRFGVSESISECDSRWFSSNWKWLKGIFLLCLARVCFYVKHIKTLFVVWVFRICSMEYSFICSFDTSAEWMTFSTFSLFLSFHFFFSLFFLSLKLSLSLLFVLPLNLSSPFLFFFAFSFTLLTFFFRIEI